MALKREAPRPTYKDLEELARLIRYYVLVSTTQAGSGHPTSSLSATDLMTVLMFGGFLKYDLESPDFPNNDRLIFSKGHAAPLLYALYAAAGKVTLAEMLNLRKFDSSLEGHPSLKFPFTEAATGSLGQGMAVGVGMALNARYIDKLPYKTYVLLGDSEMAEGSVWEALQHAAYYKLNNLIGILDVNRLGQRGETMYGYDLESYQKRIKAFGWETSIVNGHDVKAIYQVYRKALESDKPTMIIAKTIKGKGVSFLENKEGWHGKTLNQAELSRALSEVGEPSTGLKGIVEEPSAVRIKVQPIRTVELDRYKIGEMVATRKAYGAALVKIFPEFPDMVVLDGEVSNSTGAEEFKKVYPKSFFEMFIAEQTMVGIALGLSRRGKIPFVSTFGAFFSRAYDQIRMSAYSKANIKFVGSHAGVSIGEDGPSQMALEDISLFRSIFGSVVLYPSDAVACEKLVEQTAEHQGIVYLRTTRKDTPVIYSDTELFPIGGSKVLKKSSADQITILAAGITLHEALAAYEELKREGILVRVIDVYSIKPLDVETIRKASEESQVLIVVEDHYPEGGIAEAVRSALSETTTPIYSLAVRKMPQSGKPEELLDYEEISRQAIIEKVKSLL